MDFVRPLCRLLTKMAVHRVLIGRLRSRQAPCDGRFSRTDVDALLAYAWAHYQKEVARLPPQPTVGSTMNVRLACFTTSFFAALLEKGFDRNYAIELVADTTWWIYRKWARIAIALARLTPGTKVLGFGLLRNVRGRQVISLRFPFNAPGYRIRTVSTDREFAFDVVHCPVASYFRFRNASDLCLASWCSLDYPLAEMTHERLVRTKTLVGGDDRCTFRLRQKTSTDCI